MKKRLLAYGCGVPCGIAVMAGLGTVIYAAWIEIGDRWGAPPSSIQLNAPPRSKEELCEVLVGKWRFPRTEHLGWMLDHLEVSVPVGAPIERRPLLEVKEQYAGYWQIYDAVWNTFVAVVTNEDARRVYFYSCEDEKTILTWTWKPANPTIFDGPKAREKIWIWRDQWTVSFSNNWKVVTWKHEASGPDNTIVDLELEVPMRLTPLNSAAFLSYSTAISNPLSWSKRKLHPEGSLIRVLK